MLFTWTAFYRPTALYSVQDKVIKSRNENIFDENHHQNQSIHTDTQKETDTWTKSNKYESQTPENERKMKD